MAGGFCKRANRHGMFGDGYVSAGHPLFVAAAGRLRHAERALSGSRARPRVTVEFFSLQAVRFASTSLQRLVLVGTACVVGHADANVPGCTPSIWQGCTLVAAAFFIVVLVLPVLLEYLRGKVVVHWLPRYSG